MNLRDLPQDLSAVLHGPPLPPKMAARRLASEMIRGEWKSEGLHTYTDASGQVLYWRIRARLPDGSKWIRPMYVDGLVYRLGEPPHLKEGSRPLYRLPELVARKGEPVFFVEGEKCADALIRLGLLATTSGGATSDDKADFSPLAGSTVIAWPDNDSPGQQFIERASKKLRVLGSTLEIIDVAQLDLPEHGDVINYLAAHPGADAAAIHALPRLFMPTPTLPRSNGWGELDPLPEYVPSRATPFPFDGLGPVLGPAAQSIARDVQVPDAIAGASVLAAAALSAQPLADLQLPHARIPLSLFLVTAALSGDRKSATDTIACREVNELRMEQAREQARAMPDSDGKKPAVRSLVVSKATVEGIQLALRGQSHLGLFSTEGAELLGGHSMRQERRSAGIAFLCKAWDGGVLDTATKGDGLIVLPNRRVTLNTMVQPVVLASLLADPLAHGQGLIARCLIAQPETIAGTRLYRAVNANDTREVREYHRAIRTLLRAPAPVKEDGDGLELRPRPLGIAQDAFALWREFYDEVERLQAPGQELATARPFASKAAEQAARIAGIIQLIGDPAAETVSEHAIACGITMARYYLLEHTRLTGASIAAQRRSRLSELLGWMQARGPFVPTADLLQRVPYGLRQLKAPGLNPLLDELAARHYVRAASGGWEVRDVG